MDRGSEAAWGSAGVAGSGREESTRPNWNSDQGSSGLVGLGTGGVSPPFCPGRCQAEEVRANAGSRTPAQACRCMVMAASRGVGDPSAVAAVAAAFEAEGELEMAEGALGGSARIHGGFPFRSAPADARLQARVPGQRRRVGAVKAGMRAFQLGVIS